jgi:hypothetical protein
VATAAPSRIGPAAPLPASITRCVAGSRLGATCAPACGCECKQTVGGWAHTYVAHNSIISCRVSIAFVWRTSVRQVCRWDKNNATLCCGTLRQCKSARHDHSRRHVLCLNLARSYLCLHFSRPRSAPPIAPPVRVEVWRDASVLGPRVCVLSSRKERPLLPLLRTHTL